jgi:hypothetical protein
MVLLGNGMSAALNNRSRAALKINLAVHLSKKD